MRRRSQSDWMDLVHEYRSGGYSQKAFCKKHGLKLSTLEYWLYKKKPRPDLAKNQQFLPVIEAENRKSEASLELMIKDELVLKFSSALSPSYVSEIINGLA